jgi:hypothetical protein
LAFVIPSILQAENLDKVQRRFTKLLKDFGKELESTAKNRKQKAAAAIIVRGRHFLASSTISALNPQPSLASQQFQRLQGLDLDKAAREATLNRFLASLIDHNPGQQTNKPKIKQGIKPLDISKEKFMETDREDRSIESGSQLTALTQAPGVLKDDVAIPKGFGLASSLGLNYGRQPSVVGENEHEDDGSDDDNSDNADVDGDEPNIIASLKESFSQTVLEAHVLREAVSGTGSDGRMAQSASVVAKPSSTLLELRLFVMEGPAFTRLNDKLGFIALKIHDKHTGPTALPPNLPGKTMLIRPEDHQDTETISNILTSSGLRISEEEETVTLADKLKTTIENKLKLSLVWWPLRPPRPPRPPNRIRFVWNDVCKRLLIHAVRSH